MTKKILITGAGGYIGSIATSLFLQKGYEVVGVDNFSTGYKQPLIFLQNKYGKDKLRFYELDLKNDLSPLFEQEKGIDAAVHYAAGCSVNESMENPQKYFSNNVCGTQNLLSNMLNHGVNNIVFSSTCATYGEASYVPVDESHPSNPSNPYGESKLMVEKMIKWYGSLKDLHYVILRYFNVCGALEDGSIGDSKKPSTLLVQNCVRGALKIAPFMLTCPKVETEDQSPVRDYINVVDLDEAHLKALEYLFGGGESQIINLGTGTGHSVLEVISEVKKITGAKFEVTQTEARKGEYAKMIASIDRAKKVLGWEPKRSLADSINSLVLWYKDHPQGWSE